MQYMLKCSDITTRGDTNHWFALSIRETKNEIDCGAAREHCGNPLSRQHMAGYWHRYSGKMAGFHRPYL